MARSVKKGPFVDPNLRKKVKGARDAGSSRVIKTWSRRSTVVPIMSGTTVDRRDHVLMTRLLPASRAPLTFLRRFGSTNGPFLTERAIGSFQVGRLASRPRRKKGLAVVAPLDDEPRRDLLLAAGAVALGGLAPRRHG